ncbi:hypothetical protein EW026_g8177, partial [Hermanssonia centrifuga]
SAKYPIAIVAKILEVFGSDTCGGYDIGCSFNTTLANSSLGPDFKRLQSTMCVNAFHGYSHNFACQTVFHPSRIIGMGLEDLETMERIFSSSNQLAAVTCHASAYRRRNFIDLFFKQWDDDKYLNLGTMLYNNYVQALTIIQGEGVAMREAMRSLGIKDGDLEAWDKEECEYIQTLAQETEWDVHAMAYVEQLEELSATQAKFNDSNARFLNTTPEDYAFTSASTNKKSGGTYLNDFARTQKLEAQCRHLADQLDNLKL